MFFKVFLHLSKFDLGYITDLSKTETRAPTSKEGALQVEPIEKWCS